MSRSMRRARQHERLLVRISMARSHEYKRVQGILADAGIGAMRRVQHGAEEVTQRMIHILTTYGHCRVQLFSIKVYSLQENMHKIPESEQIFLRTKWSVNYNAINWLLNLKERR